MMRNYKIVASVAMALLGACVGGIDSSPGGDDDDVPSGNARQLFDSTVLPLIMANCASCHTGSPLNPTNMFLGPDGATSAYETLVKDRAVNGDFNPAAATILLKGGHDGPAWSTAQADKIAAWLRAELAVRGPTLPDPTGMGGITSARGAAMAFASCMSVTEADFTTLQAYQVALMNSQQGRCTSCHGNSAGGVNFSNTNAYKDMFLKWQQEVPFSGVFQTALQPDNTYKIAAAEAKICNKGKEKENSLGTHPTFNCTQNNSLGLNNLKAFVAKVQAKVDAKDPTCPSPAAFAPPTL